MISNNNYTQSYNEMGNRPPVVQGQAISASIYAHDAKFPEVTKGEHQPTKFNDMLWSVLFTAHLITIGCLSAIYIPQVANIEGNRMLMEGSPQKASISQFFSSKLGPQSRFLEDQDGESFDYDVSSVLTLVLISAIFGFVLSIASLNLMIKYAEGLIKAGLFFQLSAALLTGLSGFLLGASEILITGLIFFAFTACFACAVWSRIPFAATNLATATTAVRANSGLTFFAYVSIVVTIGWLIWWSTTATATIMIVADCDAEGNCNNEVNGFVLFLLLVSLYWTLQVVKNVVHVTVAGTVGTWWWSPLEANSCCSGAVRTSYTRAITYSFGSICLGSLIVAIVQAVKKILQQMRDSDDGILLCIAECCLGILESLLELFNSFAFVYVGLYGYGFIDAAKAVVNLFKERGWSAIITDSLAHYVLTMVSICVGLIVGAISALISYSAQLNVEGAAFFIGLIMGTTLTQILMGVVGSAVDTVIVCYAEDPNAFQANHPELSERMRDTWRQAYPENFRY